MNGWRRWLCLVLAPAALAAAGEARPRKQPDPRKALARLGRQMAELVNRDRAAHKLAPLVYREELAAVARAHCLDMKTNHFFAHESKRTGRPHNRVKAAGIAVRGVGENLASARDVAIGQVMLMKSPKHRANILNPLFRQIGIGIVRGERGLLIITQLFAAPVPEHDVAALHKRVVAAVNKQRVAKGLRRLVEDAELAKRALAHSQRAAKRGKLQPLWLEDLLATDVRRWRRHDVAYFLTDNVVEVIGCEVAQSRLHDHFGVGIVQSAPTSKAKGSLWITLVCAQRK